MESGSEEAGGEQGEAESGGVRSIFGEDRGGDKTGSRRIEWCGASKGRKMGVVAGNKEEMTVEGEGPC